MIPFYYLSMKSLLESIFDTDKNIKSETGYHLKDHYKFDGQMVCRRSKLERLDRKPKPDNYLKYIDWAKVKNEAKKYDALKFDLGLYSYYATDTFDRSRDALEKSEMMARLLMCVPLPDPIEVRGYNSRFVDDMIKYLSQFTSGEYSFDVSFSGENASSIRITFAGPQPLSGGAQSILCVWEFERID